MFLLKLHIEIGVLLYLIHLGNTVLFKKKMKERLDYINPNRKKTKGMKRIFVFVSTLVFCLIPIYNLFIVGTEFLVLFAKDDILDKFKDCSKSD